MLSKEQEKTALDMQWTMAKNPWKYGVQLQIIFDNYIFLPHDMDDDFIDSSKFDNNIILAQYKNPFAPGEFFNHKSKPEYFAEPEFIKPTIDYNYDYNYIKQPKKLAVFGPPQLLPLAILIEKLKRR